MTSSASQPNTNTAPNTTAASTAPSYASAAGATKKSSSTPLVVGANPPSSVAGSSAASTQHAKNPSVVNVNGRQSVSPAVPTVAHGNALNGDSANHGRNGSVTIAAPNGYNNKAPAPRDIQFGYDKTPQPTPSAPVPIPGAQRIPSPAHSPSPIPQPSASGGKPGATDSAFKIGSFTNDGDRGVPRPTSMTMPFHTRRDSAVSQHSDVGHHGAQGPNRGGFPPQGGRGRGYNPQFNNQMGYPPNNQYARGPHNQGRGGMASQGFGRGGMQPYPNSPQPARGSPAMPPAMPGQGTPNMNAAIPVPPAHGFHGHQYAPPISGPGFPPQVNTPVPHDTFFIPFSKSKKKAAARWVSETRLSHPRQSALALPIDQEYGGRQRRLSKRRDSAVDYDRFRGRYPLHEHHGPTHTSASLIVNDHVLDLAPGPDGFDRIERMLTETKQNFGYQNPYDPNRYMPMPGFSQQMPMFPPGSPAPTGYAHHYGSGGFPAPQAPAMSRNNSQMSERPASSTGQNQGPLNPTGPPPPQNAPGKGPVIASSTPTQFIKPKSSAIQIKNPQGEVVNLANLRAPASPSPGIQQSKTPPVIASTPTPPPKASTPASHTRSESVTATKPNDIIAAFKEQVKKAQEEDAKADEKTPDKASDKSAADAKAKEVERKEEEEREQKAAEAKAAEAKAAEAKAAEAKAAEIKAAEEAEAKAKAEAEAEAKAKAEAKAEAEAKAKEEAEAKAKAEEEKVAAAAAAKAEETPVETEDEYLERMIREMEEADRIREEEQAAITTKKNAEKEAAKKKADADRAANAAENDRKLREQEREMERIEEEKEKAREKARQEAEAGENKSVAETLTDKISEITSSQKKDSPAADKLSKLNITSSRDAVSPGSAPSSAKSFGKERAKPAALNLAPLKTGSVEAPPPSAAMQALKSSRFLTVRDEIKYPNGIASPNPALNAAAAKKGGSFKYDSAFLLQFQKVFTEQPSVEFSQQVKALIGDSDGSRSASSRAATGGSQRQNSNRNTIGNFSSMGTFAQPAKTLPPGTTSEQRFAIAQGQMTRPAMSGPMASFSRGGFPGTQMTRTPSGANLASSSSRNGSRNQPRGNSKRNYNDTQSEAKAAKAMPLTQGMDLKPITTSSSGWKPMSLQRNAAAQTPSGHIDPETVQRKVKAALNKMTPENFDRISEQILEIAAQSKDEQDGRTLRQVIQLTFEKATDEAHWAAMYAKFCKRMLENMSAEVKDVTITDKNGNVVSGGALFRKYLLNRCQEDFERGWAVEMPEPKEGESKETAMMSDDYYTAMAIKRRGLGLVQFIGELFKLGMLTERIMHECVRKLLDFKDEPDEAEIESLSKLLRTIGANLDSTEKGNAMMNAYFERISNLVETPDLNSRLKFMLMDIVDLRRAKWTSKDGPKGPKTLEEIRAEAEAAAAAKAAEASRTNSRNQPGGRSQLGRGDARNSYQGFPQPVSNQVGMDDLRRLKGTASRTASGNVTLGPTSMFSSRSNSGRRLGPGGALTRGAEDSGASSRTGTPPTQASVNAFAALANMPGESENPASPPSTAASPALKHAKPDSSAE